MTHPMQRDLRIRLPGALSNRQAHAQSTIVRMNRITPLLLFLSLSGCAVGAGTPSPMPASAKPAYCAHYNTATCTAMCESQAAVSSTSHCTRCEPRPAGEPPQCTTDFGCEQAARHAQAHACSANCQAIPFECR